MSVSKEADKNPKETKEQNVNNSGVLLAEEEAALLYPDDGPKDGKPEADKKPDTASDSEDENEEEAEEESEEKDDGDADKEADNEDESDDKKPEAKGVTPGVQKKINKEVAKRRAAERELQGLKDRLAALEKGDNKEGLTDKGKENTVNALVAPDPAKYDLAEYDPEYQKAKDEYLVKRAKAEFAAEQAEKQNRESATEREKKIAQQSEDFIVLGEGKFDDFDEIVTQNNDLSKISPELGLGLLESGETGVEAAYYLAKNPEELSKVVSMSPVSQIRWLGRFEAEKAPAPKKEVPKVITKAKSVKYPKGTAVGSGTDSKEDWEVLYPDDV